MAVRLPRHHRHDATLTKGDHALAMLGADETASVSARGSCLAAVDGFPEWRDSELARLASEQDFATSLCEAWQRHGAKLFEKLGGSFAIALFDETRRETVLAVDRMGQRPLCYTTGDGGVAFASSALALHSLPGVGREIERQAIYDYVYFHAVPSPGTVFRGIRKVAPGQAVTVRDGRESAAAAWIPNYGVRPRRPEGELLSVVRHAVARCRSDSGTGCFLSGGLDSSTVAGVLNEQLEAGAPAFTIGFAQEGYDEIEYARTATRHFGLDLNDYYITPEDVASAFHEVALAYDEPFGNSSAVPTLICARLAASKGITTMLAGDGGDELFAGNERYATQKLFGYYHYLPQFLRRGLIEPVFGSPRPDGSGIVHKIRRYIEQANVPMPARTQTYNLLHTIQPTNVFDPDFLASVDQEAPLQALDAAYSAWKDATPLDRMLQMDWKFTLADNDLRKVGRMCDLAGVTVRYPLLDDEVIDYSIQVASGAKLKGQRLRHFYKESMRSFLPAEIIDKPKHGFGLPFGEWLRRDENLRTLVGDRVAALKQRSVFRTDFIDDLVGRHESDHAAYYGNFVWVLAMFEEWCQQHQVSL